MKNQKPILIRAKLALWLARKICPRAQEAFLPTEDKVKTIHQLTGQIGRLHAENKKWRERCFSAERLASWVIPHLTRDAIEEHDEKFGTSLRYNMF